MVLNRLLGGVLTGIILGMLAVFLSWLLGSETSPFYQYFLHNVSLGNLWMMLNFPALMALVLTGARSFAVSLLMIFFQWFVIGFLGNLVVYKLMGKKTR